MSKIMPYAAAYHRGRVTPLLVEDTFDPTGQILLARATRKARKRLWQTDPDAMRKRSANPTPRQIAEALADMARGKAR